MKKSNHYLSLWIFSITFILILMFFDRSNLNKKIKNLEKQNETIEIMQTNDKEILKLIDTLIKNDETFLEIFCEFHFCDKSEENLIKNNIY